MYRVWGDTEFGSSVDASLLQDAEFDLKVIMQVKWDLLQCQSRCNAFYEAFCLNIYHKTWNKMLAKKSNSLN